MKAYVPAPALDIVQILGWPKVGLSFSITSHGCGPNELTGPHNSMAIAYINTVANSLVNGSSQLNGLLQRFEVFTQLPKWPSVVCQYSFSCTFTFFSFSSKAPSVIVTFVTSMIALNCSYLLPCPQCHMQTLSSDLYWKPYTVKLEPTDFKEKYPKGLKLWILFPENFFLGCHKVHKLLLHILSATIYHQLCSLHNFIFNNH